MTNSKATRPVPANSQPQRFSCKASNGFARLLAALNCSVALSTYKAGKLILLSPAGAGLTQLPRSFDRPMGMAVAGHRMAVATRREVIVLGNAPLLAPEYPRSPGKYDALWVPRARYYCGQVDIHDMSWGSEGLWAVNTRMSCLCLVNDEYSFVPRWQPPFISLLVPEDRCHLNGLAMQGGKPAYVTMLGDTDTEKGWRQRKAHGGLLMDVESSETVAANLCMPHSPRLVNGELLVLNSGTGEILQVDRATGRTESVSRLPGFVRGLVQYGNYLFVGLSRLRDQRSFGGLPLEDSGMELQAGVAVVDARSGQLVESLFYQDTVDEIYDVHILPNMTRPGILRPDDATEPASLVLPDSAFWALPGGPEHPAGERFDDYDSAATGWR